MCVCLSELLLGVPPHSGVCVCLSELLLGVPTHWGVCVCLSELLLGVTPHFSHLNCVILEENNFLNEQTSFVCTLSSSTLQFDACIKGVYVS